MSSIIIKTDLNRASLDESTTYLNCN